MTQEEHDKIAGMIDTYENYDKWEELLNAWINFKPVIPLGYILASSEAIREKYSQGSG